MACQTATRHPRTAAQTAQPHSRQHHRHGQECPHRWHHGQQRTEAAQRHGQREREQAQHQRPAQTANPPHRQPSGTDGQHRQHRENVGTTGQQRERPADSQQIREGHGRERGRGRRERGQRRGNDWKTALKPPPCDRLPDCQHHRPASRRTSPSDHQNAPGEPPAPQTAPALILLLWSMQNQP